MLPEFSYKDYRMKIRKRETRATKVINRQFTFCCNIFDNSLFKWFNFIPPPIETSPKVHVASLPSTFKQISNIIKQTQGISTILSI